MSKIFLKNNCFRIIFGKNINIAIFFTGRAVPPTVSCLPSCRVWPSCHDPLAGSDPRAQSCRVGAGPLAAQCCVGLARGVPSRAGPAQLPPLVVALGLFLMDF